MWSGTDRYEVITKDKGADEVKGRVTYYVWDDDFQWSTWYGGHPEKDKHEYYRRHFWDEEHQYYRTLEHIHRTQMFFDKKQIPYTMMIFNKDVYIFVEYHHRVRYLFLIKEHLCPVYVFQSPIVLVFFVPEMPPVVFVFVLLRVPSIPGAPLEIIVPHIIGNTPFNFVCTLVLSDHFITIRS